MYIYYCEELNCIISCQGSGLFFHTLYLFYQLLIGLNQLLIVLRLLTWPSPLTRTRDTICTSQTPNRVNILKMILLFSESSCGYHPHQVFPWLGFPQLKNNGVMSSLCLWLYLVFNIIGLLSYACFKVINYIHLWKKNCRILIHLSPPLNIIYF